MARVVLHQGEISPYCGKVRKILRVKGIAYDVENYNGLRSPKAAALTPAGKLPVLDWDGERIADSTAIAVFLDQRQPLPALYPADPRDAAMARMLEDWADESLYYFAIFFRVRYDDAMSRSVALLCEGRPAWERPVFRPIFSRMIRRKLREHGFSGRTREQIEAEFVRHLDDLETVLRGCDWLVGDSQSIADIAVSAQIDEVVRTSHLAGRIRSLPGISKWLARMAA